VQLPDHLSGALVGEGYAYYGGIYVPLGHLLSSLSYGSALSHHLEVCLSVYQVGGGLAERRVVLHEQDVHEQFPLSQSRFSAVLPGCVLPREAGDARPAPSTRPATPSPCG
jgi:hypothetical protein